MECRYIEQNLDTKLVIKIKYHNCNQVLMIGCSVSYYNLNASEVVESPLNKNSENGENE